MDKTERFSNLLARKQILEIGIKIFNLGDEISGLSEQGIDPFDYRSKIHAMHAISVMEEEYRWLLTEYFSIIEDLNTRTTRQLDSEYDEDVEKTI